MSDQTLPETVQQAAAEAYSQFETAHRPSGEQFVRVKDGAPEWITDAVRDAHDGARILPDDWTYETARSAFECISEADDPEDARHEWADAEVSVYTGARLEWLASYPYALELCDDALSEGLVSSEADLSDRIAAGWYEAATRVYSAILAACEAQVDR